MNTPWLGLCTLALIAGCGITTANRADDDDATGDDTGGGGKTSVTTVAGFLESFCAAEGACCSGVGLHADPASCAVQLGSLLAALRYDPEHGARCAEWLQSASDGYTACPASGAPVDCDLVFTKSGTKLPGEPCTSSLDCASSSEGETWCASTFASGMTVSKCQLVAEGRLGDAPCAGTRDRNGAEFLNSHGDDIATKAYICDASSGLYCDGIACVAVNTTDGPCDDMLACDATLYCDYGAGTCLPQRAVGAACDDYYACVPGAYCDSSTGMCTTSLGSGAACTTSEACASRLCVNGACSGDAGGDFSLVCAP